MKKKILINGGLKDLVTYCSAVYELENEADPEQINELLKESPIFENKSFDIKVLGTLQKTSVKRNSKVFVNGSRITLQIRYEIIQVTDIELKDEDEEWIKNDVERLLEHFETFVAPF